MELQFETKSCEAWRECLSETEKIRVDLEGVVPDVNEDVARVASVQCGVLLKSKEITGGTVRIGGEIEALVLCITENADAVQTVVLRKEFETQIEGGDTAPEEAQVSLSVLRTESRVLNPRKLSVSAELGCRVSGWARERQNMSVLPQEGDESLLCGLEERAEMQLVTGVSEKSFAVTESFPFPQDRAAIRRVLGGKARMNLTEHSRIGTRLIVKGSMEIEAFCETEGNCVPVKYRFSTPVSQILDTGSESTSCCSLQCEVTSVFLDLTDSIGGGKALDAEIHAVLQLVARRSEQFCCLKDVYSNVMPLQSGSTTERIPQCGEMVKSALTASELLPVADDCADVLSILPGLGLAEEGITADLDILYRSKMGDLCAVHRQLRFKGDLLPPDARILSAALLQEDLRPEGDGIQAALTAGILWQRTGEREITAVSGVTLEEERPFDLSAFPAVTMVRVENESVWELAKGYHSSVEAIERENDTENAAGKMLLIPRFVQQG